MGDVIRFPRSWRLSYRPAPSFAVSVLHHDGRWHVVSRKHSWDFASRSLAQAFAREIADGFGVATLVHLRGAA